LVGAVRGFGGFRADSPNFCGHEAIDNLVAALAGGPAELTLDGMLRPRNLAALTGRELTEALRSYVMRVQQGHDDSVLLAGTDKDLIEATAAHVLQERYGSYAPSDFPTLLGQAFIAVGLAPQRSDPERGGIAGAQENLEVALYDLGCAVNRLRNKGGSGHGRPFMPELRDRDISAATEAAGLVAGALLDALGS
jgi:hypothetical protein